MKDKTKGIRVNIKLFTDLDKVIGVRFKKGLCTRKEMKMPEITKQMTKTNHYRKMLMELKTKRR